MKKSISKNYIYNLTYQLLIILIPIITIPYISRVLGSEPIGKFSFYSSLVSIFSLFAIMGVNLYGTRTVSSLEERTKELSKTFWEIFILKLLTSFLSILVFLSTTIFFEDKTLIMIIAIILIGNAIDITWLFQGLERFKTIILRNSALKIVQLILLFIFVKGPDDLLLYALIMSGVELLSQGIVWLDVRNLGIFDRYDSNLKLSPLKHFKNTFVFFLPQSIILLYTNLNVTIISILSGETQTGYFVQMDKIVNIVLTIIGSLTIVIIPRISRLHTENKSKEIDSLIEKSVHYMSFLAFPIVAGIILLAPLFVPWFFGDEFTPAIIILQVLSFKVVIVMYSTISGVQYLLPTRQNKPFILFVSIGAIVSLVLNFILIPRFGVIGLVSSILITELLISISMIVYIQKEVNIVKSIISTWKIPISTLVMSISIAIMITNKEMIISVINYFTTNEYFVTPIVILFISSIGFAIYNLSLFILHDSIQKSIIKRLLKKS